MTIELERLLAVLQLNKGDLTSEELKSLNWLADNTDWRCLNNLESVFVKAMNHSASSALEKIKK